MGMDLTCNRLDKVQLALMHYSVMSKMYYAGALGSGRKGPIHSNFQQQANPTKQKVAQALASVRL